MSSVHTPAAPGTTGAKSAAGLSLGALTALVVGSMIGGGIFPLPAQMAAVASPGALAIGWLITGVGMLMLAFVFQSLANRRPDIDGGVYGYARVGFGPFIGFSTAWGYWISAWLGNVGYLVILMSGANFFLPGVVKADDGHLTWVGLLVGSVVLWSMTALCIAGVREAAVVNVIVTVAKVVPLVVFLGVAVVAFKADLFTADIWGATTQVPGDAPGEAVGLGSVAEQVRNMMLVTVWVFIGIEGASIFSERARKRSDVGKATVFGFGIVLALLVAVNFLAYGLMRQGELAGVEKEQAIGEVLSQVVGPWGAALIAGGLSISVLGAFLSWTLLCAEILRLPALDQVMPRSLGAVNAKGSPTAALVVTAACTQVAFVWAKFQPDAYQSLTYLASALILLPYLFSALFQLKSASGAGPLSSEAGVAPRRGRELTIGAVATAYAIWLVYAAGLKYLLLGAIFYLVGTAVYVWARRESRVRVFSRIEMVVFVVIAVGAVAGVAGLVGGTITP